VNELVKKTMSSTFRVTKLLADRSKGQAISLTGQQLYKFKAALNGRAKTPRHHAVPLERRSRVEQCRKLLALSIARPVVAAWPTFFPRSQKAKGTADGGKPSRRTTTKLASGASRQMRGAARVMSKRDLQIVLTVDHRAQISRLLSAKTNRS
jgi:hypothetical protein